MPLSLIRMSRVWPLRRCAQILRSISLQLFRCRNSTKNVTLSVPGRMVVVDSKLLPELIDVIRSLREHLFRVQSLSIFGQFYEQPERVIMLPEEPARYENLEMVRRIARPMQILDYGHWARMFSGNSILIPEFILNGGMSSNHTSMPGRVVPPREGISMFMNFQSLPSEILNGDTVIQMFDIQPFPYQPESMGMTFPLETLTHFVDQHDWNEPDSSQTAAPAA